MASRQFDDGAAVIVRATGEAATVIRLLPQNGIDPTNYYEIRRAGSTLGDGIAEGLLVAAPAASPVASPDATVAPPEGQQAALVAEAEHLLQEATQDATEATDAPKASGVAQEATNEAAKEGEG